MADAPVVQTGENPHDKVDLKLLQILQAARNKKDQCEELVLYLYVEGLRDVTHPNFRAGSDRTHRR